MSYNMKEIIKDSIKVILIILFGYFYWHYPFYKYFPDVWWTFWIWLGGLSLIITIFGVFLKHAVNRIEGMEGEWDVGSILNELPESYIYLPDINLEKRGNTDYVLVGSTGIWTIEVKSHAGEITFNGAELLRDGELFEERDILKQAWAEAYSVKNLLKRELNRDFEVQPVIVFSSPDAEMRFGLNKQKGVFVINLRWLKGLVEGEKNTLRKDEIDKIADIIGKHNIKD